MIIGDHLVEKTCSKCGFVGDEALFEKKKNTCKECKRKYNKQRYKEHREEISEYKKVQYINNREKELEIQKNKYKRNKQKILNRQKQYREENKEKIQIKNKRYRQTINGKLAEQKQNFKRRNLGHKPINAWFKGSEAHHLRYSKNPNEQDNDITLYIPRKLHRSIWHNGNTGQGMREINIACLEWYLNNTPEEERHPKAVKLYWNYCTLPAPDWTNGDEENGFI